MPDKGADCAFSEIPVKGNGKSNQSVDPGRGQALICRRYPPAQSTRDSMRGSGNPLSADAVKLSYYPWVGPNFWCGEFKKR